MNAYRRIDTGTKCLFAPNDLAKKYAHQFRMNKRDYMSDELWWKAAQEEDQKRVSGGGKVTTTVNPGESPTDNLRIIYLGTLHRGKQKRPPKRKYRYRRIFPQKKHQNWMSLYNGRN